eukprot:m.484236 g.484236  ORF g.484236 m.484236 type:complete len:497 (+) comp23260_c0_seq1:245-1735(+)
MAAKEQDEVAAAAAVAGDEADDSLESTGAEQQERKKKKKKPKKKASAARQGGSEADDEGDASPVKGTDAPSAKSSKSSSSAATDPPMDKAQVAAIQARIAQLSMASAANEPTQPAYKFWSTQPVPKFDDEDEAEGPLEEDKEKVRDTPYKLPAGFEWDSLNIDEETQLSELYNLLTENYVEDDDNMFRFDYSRDFLKWALQPPGWKQVWHCAVRGSKKKNLLAFISAIPARMQVRDHSQLMVEINFLCVHKKLRAKRLAPVLIKEITRRVNYERIFQAAYTAGAVLPRPVATCRYWHRSLDPKKLLDIKFSHLPRRMKMSAFIKSYQLPAETATPGLRPMIEADVPSACRLLTKYLEKFLLHPLYDDEEFAHWFLPRDRVINSFVVEDPETKEVTDMLSFYTLPSTIVRHPTHKELKAAYSYYNVATTVPLEDLMQDALILAKQLNFDVFNALDLMENKRFLEDLKFGVGDGNLRYYLYNYRVRASQAEDIGLVLL